MLDKYKVYNLRRTVLVSNPTNDNGYVEIVPRIPTEYGWVEVDLSIPDYYKDYKEYIKSLGLNLGPCGLKKVPTFKTTIILSIERFLEFIFGVC